MAAIHVASLREIDDLRLLANGGLGTAARYDGPDAVAVLHVDPAVAAGATSVGLLEIVDPEGAPLATVDVEGSYDTPAGLVGIIGDISSVTAPEFGAFRRLQLTPEEVRFRYGADALTVVVTRPLTTGDLDAIPGVTKGATVVLLVVVGAGRQDARQPALVRMALKAARHLPDAHVVTLPLTHRGERDAEVLREVVARYAPGQTLWLTDQGEGEALGVSHFAPRGLVLFFTGLSGSGKSTLARAVHDSLLETTDNTVTSLDGDIVRRHLSTGLTFSKEDRDTNIRRIGWVAAEISRHSGVAICSPIAPFDAVRKEVRAMVEQAGGRFVLIHVATPLVECERRDRKGLYAKARAGLIPDFTGITSPYDVPDDAEIRVDTTAQTHEHSRDVVLAALKRLGAL